MRAKTLKNRSLVKDAAPRPAKRINSVEAVQVALRILNTLASGRRPMGVTELADALQETKPRIHRHLSTMREMGVIEQDRRSELYRLGWRVFQLGEAAGDQFDLRELAEPYLLEIRDQLKETAVLMVPVDGRAVALAAVENVYARICITVKPGNRPPAHCSAFGRVVLAFSDPRIQAEVLKGKLAPENENPLIDQKALQERLQTIRDRFFEYADGEVLFGINTLAVPVFREGGELAGALGIVGSVQKIPAPPDAHQIAVLQDCAHRLSMLLRSDKYSSVIDTE